LEKLEQVLTNYSLPGDRVVTPSLLKNEVFTSPNLDKAASQESTSVYNHSWLLSCQNK